MMDSSTPNSGHSMEDSPTVYQGQFGEFTIDRSDRQEVLLYRLGLGLAAISLASGMTLLTSLGTTPSVALSLTGLYAAFCAGLGLSLWMIHIYLVPLHRTLQLFWGIGVLSSVAIALFFPDPLMVTVSHHPQAIWGIGFTFAAITGIFFKEAFCFNRLEAKGLTLLTPLIALGHLTGLVPASALLGLLDVAAILMIIFVLRKAFQPIPQDVGDKSVFAYLKQQRTSSAHLS